MFLLRFACGAILAVSTASTATPVHVLIGACSWELAVVFAYLYNGVTDVSGDRINGSSRPIARGSLSSETARRVAFGAALTALASGLAVGAVFTAVIACAMALGFLYSGPPCYFKRNPTYSAVSGNLGGLLTYCAGFAAAGGAQLPWAGAVAVLAMSLWMGLIGSATKDLSDLTGDTATRRRPAADRFGERTVRLAASALAIALGVAFLIVAAVTAIVAVPAATVMQIGAVLLAVVSLQRRDAVTGHLEDGTDSGQLFRNNSRQLLRAASRQLRRALGTNYGRRPYRVFMLTQYAANICLLATVMVSLLRLSVTKAVQRCSTIA